MSRQYKSGRDTINGDRVSRDEAGGSITSNVVERNSSTSVEPTNDSRPSIDYGVSHPSSLQAGVPAWLVLIIIISIMTAAGFGAEFMGYLTFFK